MGAPIIGLWKSVNEETNKPEALVGIYKHQGKFFGKIFGTFNEEGVLEDTIYTPRSRAPGVHGDPYYSGLDIIWDLKKKDDRYHGRICDPEKGKIYDAEVWREGPDLVVRGKIFFFGRNQTWLRVADNDLPSHFKKPDLQKAVPNIPKPKSESKKKEKPNKHDSPTQQVADSKIEK
jgi:uncharacterized protein (DUF2147 family)